MKFVDEVTVRIEAGDGGGGCLSFRREKFVPRGGPDGGDGGRGGSVFLIADPAINTLIEFRHRRLLTAQNGQSGMGRLRTGKSGEDLLVSVPVGTVVYAWDTGECLGDLVHAGDSLCVAEGGKHGLGNTHFKTSVDRAPRRTTPGLPGEKRHLKLELKLLADVGLLGLPNAGKSTFIRATSNATPKVADYPFTTTHPELGVVRVEENRSFVMADIPGLIAGASQGKGLGIQFLRHVSRTQLLLHLVDIAPVDGTDPAEAVEQIVVELRQFSHELASQERWLVLNKIDLLSAVAVEERRHAIVAHCHWMGPVYCISALKKQGTIELCQHVMRYLDQHPRPV
ncbi:MAG: GTPase ObgE [Coxiella sp. RIFCSPHIGHO2_12_FULL_44_14]|nr:MAG: GTPase ObgE [Coxiella sp. RIFCSPHIGHO2_12_FULL_44_14]